MSAIINMKVEDRNAPATVSQDGASCAYMPYFVILLPINSAAYIVFKSCDRSIMARTFPQDLNGEFISPTGFPARMRCMTSKENSDQ